MENHSCECSKCGKILYCPKNRASHENICDGSHSMQCPRCWKEFPNKMGKSRHVAKGTCVAVPKPTVAPVAAPAAPPVATTVVAPAISLQNSDHNTINSTTNIHNSTVIDNSINAPVSVVVNVNDFCRTKPIDTVNAVMRNPAPIQLANERQHDKLEEALAQAVYWGTPTNNNILGIESHGRNMFCLVNGKRGAIDRNEGLARMMGTVRQVARAPEVSELLGPKVRLANLADIQTPKDLAALRARYAIVVENGGEFGNSILVPEARPYFVPDAELRELILAASAHVSHAFNHPVKPFWPLVLQVCRRFGYADGRWFVGAGGLVGEPSETEVIKRIEQTHLPHEYPVPKALHHSQVDRTKVGWQLLPAPFIDLAGVPTYVRYIVVSKIRAAMLAITDEYAMIMHKSGDTHDRDLEDLGAVRERISFVGYDFLNDVATRVLQKMTRVQSEGVPVNWDDYNT